MTASDTSRPVVAVLSSPASHGPSAGKPWPGLEPLEDLADLRHAFTAEELAEAAADADVFLVTDFRNNAVQQAFPHAKRLKWIHATSAGVDKLLFPELRDSDIPLTNARGIFDRPIAEYVLSLILAFAKDLPGTLDLQRRRRWQHRDTEPVEDRHVLVIGAGSIGRQIGHLCRAVGMRTTGIATRPRTDDAFDAVHATDTLPEHLPHADYIVIAAPLTPQTHHLVNADLLAHAQPTARLINIGRGEIVDTDALVAALSEQRLVGAALDVFETEPLPDDHPLWQMPNVIVSPHMAGDLEGWRTALSDQFIDLFRQWKETGELTNLVDKTRGYTGPQ